jgi:hypothetical protein
MFPFFLPVFGELDNDPAECRGRTVEYSIDLYVLLDFWSVANSRSGEQIG